MSFSTDSTQVQTIDIDAGSNSHRQFVLDTVNTTSSKLYYELRNIATPPSSGVLQPNQGITFYYESTDLKVNHNDGTHGSGDPTYPSLTNSVGTTDAITVVAGNTVYGYSADGTTLRVQYDVPTFTASGGGGTSTEGWSYSGSLTVVGTTLQYSIPASSSAGTYTLMSSASATPQITITHGSSTSTGSAPNFDQTKIWTLLSPYGDVLDEINLTSKKKVFCNFW